MRFPSGGSSCLVDLIAVAVESQITDKKKKEKEEKKCMFGRIKLCYRNHRMPLSNLQRHLPGQNTGRGTAFARQSGESWPKYLGMLPSPVKFGLC